MTASVTTNILLLCPQSCQSPQPKEAMTLQWFADIPAEVRLEVYKAFFQSIEVYNGYNHVLNNMSNTAPLNLFLSSKRLKTEAEPCFWSSSAFIFTPSPLVFDELRQCRLFDVQSLTLRSGLCGIRGTVGLVRRLTGARANKKMECLKIEARFDIPVDSDTLGSAILLCRNRVKSFQLHLRKWVDPRTAGYMPWREPEAEDFGCTLEIRDAYSIFITNGNEYFLKSVRGILKTVYDDDFSKVKFIENKCCRPS